MTLSRHVTLVSRWLCAHQRLQSLEEGWHFAATLDSAELGLGSQQTGRTSAQPHGAIGSHARSLAARRSRSTGSSESAPACEPLPPTRPADGRTARERDWRNAAIAARTFGSPRPPTGRRQPTGPFSGERLQGILHQAQEFFPIERRLDFPDCRSGLCLTFLPNSLAGIGTIRMGSFQGGSSSIWGSWDRSTKWSHFRSRRRQR